VALRLTLKSVTQPVRLDVKYLGTGAGLADDIRAGFEASTQLDREEFGMIWNQSLLAGVFTVGRTLRVTIDVEAVWSR
jgi:polyisoprenoid-binding protein YceI